LDLKLELDWWVEHSLQLLQAPPPSSRHADQSVWYWVPVLLQVLCCCRRRAQRLPVCYRLVVQVQVQVQTQVLCQER